MLSRLMVPTGAAMTRSQPLPDGVRNGRCEPCKVETVAQVNHQIHRQSSIPKLEEKVTTAVSCGEITNQQSHD